MTSVSAKTNSAQLAAQLGAAVRQMVVTTGRIIEESVVGVATDAAAAWPQRTGSSSESVEQRTSVSGATIRGVVRQADDGAYRATFGSNPVKAKGAARSPKENTERAKAAGFDAARGESMWAVLVRRPLAEQDEELTAALSKAYTEVFRGVK